MPKIPILCMSCGASIPEEEYLQHMQRSHGTIHTDEAMQKEKIKKANIPAPVVPTELPLGVRPEDLPSPEFLAIAKEIDTAPPLEPLPKLDRSKLPIPISSKPPEPKVLELKYNWEGVCPNCGEEIKTLLITLNNLTIAVAYCIKEQKQVNYMKLIPISQQITYEKGRDSLEQGETRSSSIYGKVQTREKKIHEIKVEKRHRRRKKKDVSSSLQEKNSKSQEEHGNSQVGEQEPTLERK